MARLDGASKVREDLIGRSSSSYRSMILAIDGSLSLGARRIPRPGYPVSRSTAVASVPDDRPDHAEAAAEIALGMLDVLRSRTWSRGDPVQVRIGMASGPAAAGVIGRRTFTHDMWGDTVNLASRLESGGEPGRIQVSEDVRAARRPVAFVDARIVDLKGKGPTRTCFLLGRKADAATGVTARTSESVR